MDNKEIARELRKAAGNPASVLDVADRLDPASPYAVGTYVTTHLDSVFIMANREEWLENDGSKIAIEENYPLFFTSSGYPMYTSAGAEGLRLWVSGPQDKGCLDKNGNPCPAEFAVKTFKKGHIYKIQGFTGRNTNVRIFDGNKFIMPGQSPCDCSEMGDEATAQEIETYFDQAHSAFTGQSVLTALAKTME